MNLEDISELSLALKNKYHDPIYRRSLGYKFMKLDSGWQRSGVWSLARYKVSVQNQRILGAGQR